jgi:hypothetical protein
MGGGQALASAGGRMGRGSCQQGHVVRIIPNSPLRTSPGKDKLSPLIASIASAFPAMFPAHRVVL